MTTMRHPGKRLRITDKDITAFLNARKMTRADLAELLNVNPASLSRWADPNNPQAPTSTTYLILIPLLLAAGVEFLPNPTPGVIENQLATFKGLGLLKEDELKNEQTRKSLHRAIAVLNNEDVKASHRLFIALQEAWKKVDESLLHRK
jgi:transcriptional regulator with XRE-family HTH domain